MRPINIRLCALVLFVLSLGGCQQAVVTLEPQVLATYPHDSEAFTQGLLFYDGYFYESTGIRGRSSLREVIPETGEVLRVSRLPDEYFGEGLARVDDRLIQITWQSGRAFTYDLETFNPTGEFSYTGEGWGLCYDGANLYMSDGSATLTVRDPDTFEAVREIAVTQGGAPVTELNELECVGGDVYANVWRTDRIVRIDKESGEVVADIDASGLLSAEERQALEPNAVLNGIAYNPGDDTFFITGKLWPEVFKVRFVKGE